MDIIRFLENIVNLANNQQVISTLQSCNFAIKKCLSIIQEKKYIHQMFEKSKLKFT